MKIKIDFKNRERIAIAMKMGQPDRVPIDFSIGNQFNYMHGWLGLDGRRFILDPAYTLESEIKFIEKFNVEGILGPVYGIIIEPSFFECVDIIIPKDTSPWVIGHLNTVEKLKDYLKNYKEPDPYTAGKFPLFCNGYFYFKKILGDLIDAPMGMLGPFNTAAMLTGSTNLFTWIKTEPNLVHELLKKVTEFFLKNIEVRVEIFKPKNQDFTIYDDYLGFLSKKDFLEFSFPYNKKIWDYYTEENSIRQLHCDAPMNHIMDLLPEMGVNALLSFDPVTDINIYKEKISSRVCLIGNIHPLKVMCYRTPEEVKKEVKRQLDVAKKNGGYIISTGGELGDGTPNENIQALIEATNIYGKY